MIVIQGVRRHAKWSVDDNHKWFERNAGHKIRSCSISGSRVQQPYTYAYMHVRSCTSTLKYSSICTPNGL